VLATVATKFLFTFSSWESDKIVCLDPLEELYTEVFTQRSALSHSQVTQVGTTQLMISDAGVASYGKRERPPKQCQTMAPSLFL
jgi:hypothetical protein